MVKSHSGYRSITGTYNQPISQHVKVCPPSNVTAQKCLLSSINQTIIGRQTTSGSCYNQRPRMVAGIPSTVEWSPHKSQVCRGSADYRCIWDWLGGPSSRPSCSWILEPKLVTNAFECQRAESSSLMHDKFTTLYEGEKHPDRVRQYSHYGLSQQDGFFYQNWQQRSRI